MKPTAVPSARATDRDRDRDRATGRPHTSMRRAHADHSTTSNAKHNLTTLADAHLKSKDGKYNEYELEILFGTRGVRPITRQDFHNVVAKLKSQGFTTAVPNGTYTMKIIPDYMDAKTAEMRSGAETERLRVEIHDFHTIQEYCRTNRFSDIHQKQPQKIQIVRKSDVFYDLQNKTVVSGVVPEGVRSVVKLQSANYDDFNFRVSLRNEETISKSSNIAMNLIESWERVKKVFRYINRVSFTHPQYPFRVDLSVVRSSGVDENGRWIKAFEAHESGVFQNAETFELEVEAIGQNVRSMYIHNPDAYRDAIQNMAKIVLSGLQNTNYPVGYSEHATVLEEYLTLLHADDHKHRGEEYNVKKRVQPSDFIGPSSISLQRMHIAPPSQEVITPNITHPFSYCVTEKADGERRLLYVNGKGRIYMIDTRMNVIFTGAVTENERCFHSLLDGEFIAHNKQGVYIHLYAAFDIYYVNRRDVRDRPFMKVPPHALPEHVRQNEKERRRTSNEIQASRLQMMYDWIRILNAKSVLELGARHSRGDKRGGAEEGVRTKEGREERGEAVTGSVASQLRCPIQVVGKKFYPYFQIDENATDMEVEAAKKENATELYKYDIFNACGFILQQIRNSLFDYEVDGLIFTPTMYGVGADKMYASGPKHKITWQHSFKWKPSEATDTFPTSYNTIDFLVSTKKNADKTDVITPLFENGVSTAMATQYSQYKTLVLAVGFDETRHGFINPCQDLLEDRIPALTTMPNGRVAGQYRAKQFFPSDPYDPTAGLCNMLLEMDGSGEYRMFTEERDVFEDQMIVEFKYDSSKPPLWRWVPLRVRYDKTDEFRKGQNSFGNDYNTANGNWYSIHNPITERMISTGDGIPTVTVSEDVYYNGIGNDKLTKGMRDFHNLYVKKQLIQNVSRQGDILIDLACGKGGDIPKWIDAGLSFVFGVDLSKDNIENRLNGACARYLTNRAKYATMPYMLFVNGNSALNIRSGKHMFSEKANAITRSVFGLTGVNSALGSAVARQHGKGANGFDVCSCQFAIHYMFKSVKTFYPFVQNIAECTKLNGHFIATCYDGRTIFNRLKTKAVGELDEIYHEGKKVWSVTKKYAQTFFENNESSLGYEIDVFQDTINQTLTEYLVNFEFFVSVMEMYGLVLLTPEQAKEMRFPSSSGMFSELYNQMVRDVKKTPTLMRNYDSAVHMKSYEKEVSFLNRFFVFRKVRNVDAEQVTMQLMHLTRAEKQMEEQLTMDAVKTVEKAVREVAEEQPAPPSPVRASAPVPVPATDAGVGEAETIIAPATRRVRRVTQKAKLK